VLVVVVVVAAARPARLRFQISPAACNWPTAAAELSRHDTATRPGTAPLPSDLGVSAATDGDFDFRVVRARDGDPVSTGWHYHVLRAQVIDPAEVTTVAVDAPEGWDEDLVMSQLAAQTAPEHIAEPWSWKSPARVNDR
jgi:hypothetical protein